jgi:hypothetical protein
MDRTKTTQCIHTYNNKKFSPLHELSSEVGVGSELEEGKSVAGRSLVHTRDETASVKKTLRSRKEQETPYQPSHMGWGKRASSSPTSAQPWRWGPPWAPAMLPLRATRSRGKHQPWRWIQEWGWQREGEIIMNNSVVDASRYPWNTYWEIVIMHHSIKLKLLLVNLRLKIGWVDEKLQ